jgi:hypothetical protein
MTTKDALNLLCQIAAETKFTLAEHAQWRHAVQTLQEALNLKAPVDEQHKAEHNSQHICAPAEEQPTEPDTPDAENPV